MTRSERIRQFAAAQPEPVTAATIAAGIGEPGSLKAFHAICSMARDGFLRVVTRKKPFTYAAGRTDFIKAPKKTGTQEQRDQRNARANIRDMAKRHMAPDQYAQWVKDCASKDKAVREAAVAKGAKLHAERLRVGRVVRTIKADNVAKDRREGARHIVAMRSGAMATQPTVSDERPCTDSWLAENGADPAKYQKLPPGTWSSPLRFEY